MVGNGVTNWDYDTSPAVPATTYQFNMIPKKYMDFFEKNGCKYYGDEVKPHLGPDSCDAVEASIQKLISSVSFYDLYMPADAIVDSKQQAEERIGKVVIDGEERTYKRGRTKAEYTPWIKKTGDNLRVEYHSLTDFVNSPEVRKAMNIPNFVQAWEQCSDRID